MKPIWSLAEITAQLTRDGAAWNAAEPIPYAFYESSAAHLGSTPGFSALSTAQRQALSIVLDLISDIVPLDFVQVPANGAQPGEGNERIGFYNVNGQEVPFWGAATNYQTGPSGGVLGVISGADVVINLFRANAQGGWGIGDSNVRKMMHEVLHTLGLAHPGDYNGDSALNYENEAEYRQDSNQYTVMSYWGAAETGASHPSSWAATPLLHDVAALQSLYGANLGTRTGDTVYGFGSTAGRAAYDLAINLQPVFTIWDAGGIDTLDLSGFFTASRIDLRPGTFTDAGGLTRNISIAYGAMIENAVGGSGADDIIGNNAANLLNGRGAGDRMEGGRGDDVYVVNSAGDLVVERAGEGSDLVRSSISYTLGGGVEDLTLAGGATVGTGNAAANRIEGNSGSNRLSGGGSADWLDGSGGADLLLGGTGHDHFVFDDAGDRAIEEAGEGTDTVVSTVTARLTANVENLVLGGTAAIAGTGNAAANRIEGNRAANDLAGGLGDDGLWGGAGQDRLRGGSGADRFFFDTALGRTNIDSILDFRSADDAIFLDRSVFTGIIRNGQLREEAFQHGSRSLEADDRILHDRVTGEIFYDGDGAGGSGPVLFAVVEPGRLLTPGDFIAFI